MKSSQKSYLVSFEEHAQQGAQQLGGKGLNLCRLFRAGFPVPPGFVVTAECFFQYLKSSSLDRKIAQYRKELDPDDLATVRKAATKISSLILQLPFNGRFASELKRRLTKLGLKRFSVRSSATMEDSKSASWAGELESFLNIAPQKIVPTIKRCWASFFSPRSLIYQTDKKKEFGLAVVIQKMLDPDFAGVAFTQDPLTRREDIVIEAGRGLGEVVVAGQIIPDRYIVIKEDLAIKKIEINIQRIMRLNDRYGVKEIILTEEEGAEQKLSDIEVQRLAFVCLNLEKYFHYPQDIEWAMKEGKIYILQARPIVFHTT
ncbi:MAG: PEP/pyruvate-binding domain-containing protein [Candidatus Doudnabacteria bacterium]|nr:PEP/pyruvate-binding domain-containing protein [Candidatus Doudnabacteria bacterium]